MKFNRRKAIFLRFYDHGMGFESPPISEILGWIIDETDLYYILSPWIVPDQPKDIFDENLEKFSILKSTIIIKKSINLQGI